MQKVVQDYNKNNIHIGIFGSHSAEEVGMAAKSMGLPTYIICQAGREKLYLDYNKHLYNHALVLETDSPYLTPKSKGRGRNEPAYVRSVAERVAELRSTDLKTVSRDTTRNAGRLFRWARS